MGHEGLLVAEKKSKLTIGDKVHCIGQQTGGFLDLEPQRVTKMPEVFQNLLK